MRWKLRTSLFVVGVTLGSVFARDAAPPRRAIAQKVDSSSTSVMQEVMLLNFANEGQHLTATVGQQIEIGLGAVGACEPCEPQLSSPAIRFESVALPWPRNPGITAQI